MHKIDDLIDIVIGLHNWREKYNKNSVGFGADIFLKEGDKAHFPHAYALWGRGYINLYKTTGEKKYLDIAVLCAEWLMNNYSKRYRNMSWGLPLGWQGSSSDLSFSITTLYSANLLIDLYQTTENKKYKDALKSIRQWLIEENGYIIDYQESNGIWFKYANDPTFYKSVYCITAYASAFFAKMYSLSIGDRKENAYFSVSCAKYILYNQNRLGFWYYNEVKKSVDIIHSQLVLEALIENYKNIPYLKEEHRQGIINGYNYLIKNMFFDCGYAPELYALPHKEIYKITNFGNSFYRFINYLYQRNYTETRSMGYGSTFRTFSMYSETIEDNKRILNKIFKYFIYKYRKDNGSFKYKINNSVEYIRDLGHIFDGLSYMALTLSKKNLL